MSTDTACTCCAHDHHSLAPCMLVHCFSSEKHTNIAIRKVGISVLTAYYIPHLQCWPWNCAHVSKTGLAQSPGPSSSSLATMLAQHGRRSISMSICVESSPGCEIASRSPGSMFPYHAPPHLGTSSSMVTKCVACCPPSRLPGPLFWPLRPLPQGPHPRPARPSMQLCPPHLRQFRLCLQVLFTQAQPQPPRRLCCILPANGCRGPDHPSLEIDQPEHDLLFHHLRRPRRRLLLCVASADGPRQHYDLPH